MNGIISLIFWVIIILVIWSNIKNKKSPKKQGQAKPQPAVMQQNRTLQKSMTASQKNTAPQQKAPQKSMTASRKKAQQQSMTASQKSAASQQSAELNQSAMMQPIDASIGSDRDMMAEIEDVMIKGYVGDLTFERDFISEGIEMINSFQA